MAPSPPYPDERRKIAIHWLVKRKSGRFDAADQVAFERWLAEDPSHHRTFEALDAAWSGLACPQAELASARAHRPPRRFFHFWSMALAAGLLAAVGLGSWEGWPLNTETIHRTAKGEHSLLTLADGSQVELNSDSEIAVHYGLTARSIELRRGEALFSVAPGKLRPFEVEAAGGRIRDIGTRFDVALHSGQTSVLVLEGKVNVLLVDGGEQQGAGAGKALTYDAGGILSAPQDADLEVATAWREGKLIFRTTPLKEVVTEFARYHDVEFRFADPGIEQLSVSGVFDADKLDLFLATLEAIYRLQVKHDPDGTVVMARRKSSLSRPPA
ncbi:MAG: FecR domain-containing protein [Methylococcaceae bacterium]|nr:FecR domain-containing protein [Methylococcaceae bacterium]